MAMQLFLPLKGEYFDAFASGRKTVEYRAYGPRWNEGTCWEGRRVLLSRGYGKQKRLHGVVDGFERLTIAQVPEPTRSRLIEWFGLVDIAAIRITTRGRPFHG